MKGKEKKRLVDRNQPAWRRQLRYFYLRFIRLQGDPTAIARGVAIGTFVGITPTIPFHTILALLISLLLRGSKIAALLATIVVSNPLTFFFQYYLAWKIGNWLTPSDLSWDRISEELTLLLSDAGFMEKVSTIGKLGMETIIGVLLGGCLLALPFTLIGFFVALYFFSTIKRKRILKRNLKL